MGPSGSVEPGSVVVSSMKLRSCMSCSLIPVSWKDPASMRSVKCRPVLHEMAFFFIGTYLNTLVRYVTPVFLCVLRIRQRSSIKRIRRLNDDKFQIQMYKRGRSMTYSLIICKCHSPVPATFAAFSFLGLIGVDFTTSASLSFPIEWKARRFLQTDHDQFNNSARSSHYE